jgi:N-acyl homoserine lactone hydrolase
MRRSRSAVLLSIFGALLFAAPPRPASVHLYVFDCGTLKVEDPARFNFKKEELALLDLAVPCFLVVHPRGTVMWDTGVVPDSGFRPGAAVATKEYATATRTLGSQLAAIGYSPGDIQYLALSHNHWDHVGNAAMFASATWLVSKVERDGLFGNAPPARVDVASLAPLQKSRTTFLPDRDYDVFGDGTVVIKPAPGHTPGHRVLFLKLAKTGPLVLCGDLYHYPEERTTGRVPAGDFDKAQTVASRAELEKFLKQNGAQLWIQHDLAAFRKLRLAPAYYE